MTETYIIISRNIKSYHAAINPKLIRNKDNFLIKLRIHFPEIQIQKIEKINQGKYFYFKKRISQMKEKNFGV